MGDLIRRFIRDESAQEIVEYAYLSLFVGLVGIVLWGAIVQLLGLHYDAANTGTQGLWEPVDITGGGS